MEEQDQNRRRNGAIDKLNNAASTIQKARFLASAIQKGSTVVKVAPILPWVLVAIIVIIVILVIIFLLTGGGSLGTTGTNTVPPSNSVIPGLILDKTGPANVPNGQNITFTVSGSYTGSDNIVLSDQIPANSTFVGATGTFKHEVEGGKELVSWSLKDNIAMSSQSARPYSFQITLRPTKDDIIITNYINAAGSAALGQETSPNTDNCSGKYNLSINPLNKNFGDPSCALPGDPQNRDQIYSLLKQQDPENADFWFAKVIPCESSYNPNSWYRCDQNGRNCTPDPNGAWGLLQMGSSTNGAGTPGDGRNGPLDRGDVVWNLQVYNAVQYYLTKLKPYGTNIGAYWQCAR